MENNNLFLDDFRDFLAEKLIPLLGIVDNSSNILEESGVNESQVPVLWKDGKLYFGFNNEWFASMPLDKGISSDDLSLAMNVLNLYYKASSYIVGSSHKNVNYISDIQKSQNLDYCIEKGICNWIVGRDNSSIDRLLSILEKWSVKTYEGKKVTFGFVIDPERESSAGKDFSFLNFLEDDFSAVLTDCVSSVILLDQNCRFLSYESSTAGKKINSCDLINNLPYRFAYTISTFVTGKRIGIFLLNNGDIIISKNQTIKFVKRNLRWLNFSFEAFLNAVKMGRNTENVDRDLLQDVFSSAVDVSFAHCGGIIAITGSRDLLIQTIGKEQPILSEGDDLANGATLEQLQSTLSCSTPKMSAAEIAKRLLKRQMVQNLSANRNFKDLDRKLRCDLIGLDGACILDKTGSPISFGAIIKNDSGSSGGGRGAAAKKLSNYGLAIKISTDGYIELFINGENVYSIK